MAAQVQGEIVDTEHHSRGRRSLVVRLCDGSGELNLRFLNFYPSQVAQLARGALVRAHGEVRSGLFGFEMVHPRYRLVSPGTPLPQRLTPVYPTSSTIPQHQLRKVILEELRQAHWRDTIPAEGPAGDRRSGPSADHAGPAGGPLPAGGR